MSDIIGIMISISIGAGLGFMLVNFVHGLIQTVKKLKRKGKR